MHPWVYQWLWCCLWMAPVVLPLWALEQAIHRFNLGYIPMEELRETYCVWPDDTKALLCEVAEGLYNWMSDDYIVVSLTEEQHDTMTYDEMVKCSDVLEKNRQLVIVAI